MYDSPSDSSAEEESLENMILYGSFNDVDTLLRDGASLDVLEYQWDEFVKDFLLMENWRSKIKNIQLLYLYHCTRQLGLTNNPAVFLMELRCNVKSWVFIASFDEQLFVERLEPYLNRFDELTIRLYEDALALCRTEPTHEITIETLRVEPVAVHA